ncbi:phosphoadenosine phosphosulfate reductase family protein [Sphingomonadaceae bacterium G21617-S1]|nr:phosphoadenosine phosphosulfate reductase family protein [Sphingomonadaceae bacterium G21617-S1]
MMIALDPAARAAIAAGAPIAFSLSGGKDSIAIASAAMRALDGMGHPRNRRVAIHADLGRIDWPSTPATVEAGAASLGLPLIVVRRGAGDLVARWERRFELGSERYAALATYHLTGPWSSAANRFCTSELKTQVILPELLRRYPGEQILSVVGIRREESLKRRGTPISKAEGKAFQRANGGRIVSWHPGVDWKLAEVWAEIAAHQLPVGESYALGSERYGCAFCVLASLNDLTVAARSPGNRGLLFHLVDMEAKSTFSFQPDRWLGELARDYLPASLAADLRRGQNRAAERRAIEAALPAGLKYVAGWPQRMPTPAEAEAIVQGRAKILAMHNLETPYTSAALVMDRFADLIAQRELKAAA